MKHDNDKCSFKYSEHPDQCTNIILVLVQQCCKDDTLATPEPLKKKFAPAFMRQVLLSGATI